MPGIWKRLLKWLIVTIIGNFQKDYILLSSLRPAKMYFPKYKGYVSKNPFGRIKEFKNIRD